MKQRHVVSSDHSNGSNDQSTPQSSVVQSVNTHQSNDDHKSLKQVSMLDFKHHFNTLFRSSKQSNKQTNNQSVGPLTSSYLPCLDGLRALLSISMISYHSYAFLIYYMTMELSATLWNSLLMLRIGPMIVDGFLILTGFVTALPICIQEQSVNQSNNQASNQQSSTYISFDRSKFLYRRFSRLLPLAIVTYLIHQSTTQSKMMDVSILRNEGFVRMFSSEPSVVESIKQTGAIPSLCEHAGLFPVQFSSVNQFLPFGGCQGWTWSMGIQITFLLWFATIYHRFNQPNNQSSNQRIPPTRQMLPLIKWCLIIWLVVRILSFFSVLTAPLAEMEGGLVLFFWYSNTVTRIGSILLGMLAAMILTAPDVNQSNNQSKFDRFASTVRRVLSQPKAAYVVLFVTCSLLSLLIYYSGVPIEAPGSSLIARSQLALVVDHSINPTFPPSLEQLMHFEDYLLEMTLYVLAIAGGPLINLLVVCLIISLIICPSDSLIGRCRHLLDHKMWQPFSTLSYAAYLVHPSIQTAIYQYVVTNIDPLFGPSPITFCFLAILMVCFSFTIALPLHMFIDSPINVWLSRDRGSKTRLTWWYACVCMFINFFAHLVVVPIMFMYAPKGEINKSRYLGL